MGMSGAAVSQRTSATELSMLPMSMTGLGRVRTRTCDARAVRREAETQRTEREREFGEMRGSDSRKIRASELPDGSKNSGCE